MTAQETKEKILNGEIYPLINEQIDGHSIICKEAFLLDDISFILMITHRRTELDIHNDTHVNILSISFDDVSYYQIYESEVPYYINNIQLSNDYIFLPVYVYNSLLYPTLNINITLPILGIGQSKTEPFKFIEFRNNSDSWKYIHERKSDIIYSQVEKLNQIGYFKNEI